MDRLERRLIQLKIEREAVKKDESSAAEKELVQLDEQIQTIERDYAGLEEIWLAEKAAVQSVTQIKSDIEQAKLDLEVARRAGDLTVMSEIHCGWLPELEQRLHAAAEADQSEPTLLCSRVTDEEVAEVVSRWTGIPIAKMLESDREKLLQMEETLHGRVIGQDEAVTVVSHAVRRARAVLQIRTDLTVLFYSSGLQEWVKPSYVKRSQTICLIASKPWSASTCRNLWSSTPSPD